MEDLAGKVAVVTGAASGIGLAVANALAAAGMKVVLADVEEEPLRIAEKAITGTGAEAIGVVTDVSDGAAVEALRDRALDAFGAVHVVHNNAGVGAGGPMWTISESDWAWVLGVNLWGVVHGIRVFAPLLVDQGEGHIVNTASMAGLLAAPMMGPYNASKHAVVGISETLAKDLQLHGSPVGVSLLCPGFVRTRIAEADRNRPSGPGQTEIGAAGFDFLKQLVEQGMPPEDVARRVVDAIRSNTFWVLTHPELKPAVEAHAQEIIEERNPSAAFFA